MLLLSDEQVMVRETALSFFADHGPSQLRARRETGPSGGFDRALWRAVAEMGFAGVLIPEAHGGVALGHVSASSIMQALGQSLSVTPFLATALIGTSILLQSGSAAMKAQLLPAIARGDGLLAVASEEQSRHRPHHIDTRAVADGPGFRISGRKTAVIGGGDADWLIVAARTSGDLDSTHGITLFLVHPDTAGITIGRRATIDSHPVAEILFDAVEVDDAAVLGPVDNGWPVLEHALDIGRVALAGEMLGIADRCFSMSVDYLKQRVQFGVRIGSFQALQHRAARLYCDLEVARSSLLAAAQALDAGADAAALLASQSKAKIGEVAALASAEAIQWHGGIGMTDELDIGLYFKRARVAREALGDPSYHADRLARLMGY